VPLLFRVPGMTAADTLCPMPLSQVQVLPTLAEICNVPIGSRIDGRSFAAQLRQPGDIRDNPVFAEYALRTTRSKYMLRRHDYKYTYWVHDMPELYNLRDDPKEIQNLALVPTQRHKVEEMKAELFAWQHP